MSNLENATSMFEQQIKLAMGQITPEMIQEFMGTFAENFADEVELKVNPKADPPGPTLTGSFNQVMATVGGIWEGVVNTRAVNDSVTVLPNDDPYDTSDDVIAVHQKYDNHLVDVDGKIIAGTENKWFVVVQSLGYDGFGKVNSWTQEFDNVRLEEMRAAANSDSGNIALATKLFESLKTMVSGQIDNKMRAAVGAKVSKFFTPRITIVNNPGTLTEQKASGSFQVATAGIASTFNGFVNTVVDIGEIAADFGSSDVDVAWTITAHLLDAGGNKIDASEIPGFVINNKLTFENGKISTWQRTFDQAILDKARQAKADVANDIVALAKATWETQRKMAYGDVSPEMFHKFATEFASNFAPEVSIIINPKDTVPGPSCHGTFAECMAINFPIWQGFVNTKIVNNKIVKKGTDTVVVTQKFDHHLVDANGAKIRGTETKWFLVTSTCVYVDGLIKTLTQEFKNEILLKVRAKAKAVTDAQSPHARIGFVPLKPGAYDAAIATVRKTFPSTLATFDGLFSLDMCRGTGTTGGDELTVISRYHTKAQLDKASPKVRNLLVSLKEHFGGKPEMYGGKISWNYKGRSMDDLNNGALRTMVIPASAALNEEAMLAVAETPAMKKGLGTLGGLVSGEAVLVDGKMITVTKYQTEAQMTTATPKVPAILANMKQFMAGPPAPHGGARVFHFSQ